jgi:hypothetical protein
MGTVKKAGKAGARSVANRSPSTPKKRAPAPRAAISEPASPELARLTDYLRADNFNVVMWKGGRDHFPSGTAATLARIDKALSAAYTITSLLDADERGMREARATAGDEEYSGLGDYFRAAIFNAQDILQLDASCG